MSIKEQIKTIEAEIRHLKQELLIIGKELQGNPESTVRKMLLDERAQVLFDIEEAQKHLEQLKELPEDLDNDKPEGETINEESPDAVPQETTEQQDLH